MFALARSSFAAADRGSLRRNRSASSSSVEVDLEDFIRGAIPLVGDVAIKGSGVEVRFLKANAEPQNPDDPDEKR